ncbi:DGQHR domain-containing protein [uncultured Pseudoalteromonas sp.]|uniref:DGQHR domain-containing protein n=1 Tax=uncultured Pseudoalteromonas sp. TaxID=114053 RepID=UPI00259A4201|nr:DGQHR domain-containing protein [uncultured Pseudoalteromonas sp.]
MTYQTTSKTKDLTDLNLTLFKANEGISKLGVRVYEGVMTFKELAKRFPIEANSDELSEEFKRQRDVGTPRLSALKKYWQTSNGSVFPNITLFANVLTVTREHTIGNKELVEATLSAEAATHIGDGQGRTSLIKYLLDDEANSECENHTISFKLIITDTMDLHTIKADKIIKKVFNDYHVNMKRPNQSISKHFDYSNPLSVLVNDCLEFNIAGGIQLKKRIALHGNIKRGHVWTFQQFTSMIQKFLNVTPANSTKMLGEPDNFNSALRLCQQFTRSIFEILPAEMLDSDDFSSIHENTMFTRAIFSNALGYVGRSLFDEMLLDNSVQWSKLSTLKLPICDKTDTLWIKSNVTIKDGNKIKILKGTDKRIAALICNELRIYPCAELFA